MSALAGKSFFEKLLCFPFALSNHNMCIVIFFVLQRDVLKRQTCGRNLNSDLPFFVAKFIAVMSL